MTFLELVDRIVSFMDNGDTPIGIFLALSKAIDTLNHSILLHKLKHYGLYKSSTGLIKKYLENRTQYVNFNSVNSDYQKINCVNNFNFPGLLINKYLNWNNHIDHIS